MKITRDVILDLLPLFVSGEGSPDTRKLVEEYIETDPEIAEIAKDSTNTAIFTELPVTLTKEDEMEAYREAKQAMFKRMVTIGAIIAFATLGISALAMFLAFFRLSS
jgi:anti-sigma factor RsiW